MGAGGLSVKAILTVGAESVSTCTSSADLKKPTEGAPLGHISWMRQAMDRGIVDGVHWRPRAAVQKGASIARCRCK
eukprot:4715631-Pyramimonas_sp.AAC.1